MVAGLEDVHQFRNEREVELRPLDGHRVAEDLFGGPETHHLPPLEDGDLVHEEGDEIDDVSRHDHGDPLLLVQILEEVHEGVHPHRIEAGGRLVQDDHLRPHRQHPRHADPLFLPVGKGVDRLAGEFLHLHLVQRPVHPLLHLPGRQPHVDRPESDVLLDGGGEELIVGVLEDDADAAENFPVLYALHRFAIEKNPPQGGAQQTVEMLDEGRLAAAVGAEDRQKLPPPDLQIDPVERRRPVLVGIVKILESEHLSFIRK